jgi:hypothetical protein
MRKAIILFAFLFASGFVFGQIPSINENYRIEKSTPIQKQDLTDFKAALLDSIDENYQNVINELETRKEENNERLIVLNFERQKGINANLQLERDEKNIILDYLNSEYNKNIDEIKKEQNQIEGQIESIELLKLKNELMIEQKISLAEKADSNSVNKMFKAYYKSEIKKINDKIIELEKTESPVDIVAIKKIENQKEKLLASKKNLENNENIFAENKYNPNKFLPSSSFFRDYFFSTHYNNSTEHTNFLNALTILRNNTNNTISTELVTDNLSSFRISFGTVVAFSDENDMQTEEDEAEEDETEDSNAEENDKDLEKLLNGGGNFYLDFTLPVYTNYSENVLSCYTYINLKTAADIKGFDSDIRDTSANFSFGISQYLAITSDNNKFNFALSASHNIHYGLKDFRENLDLPNRVFFNANLSFFITVDSKFRIALRTNLASEPSLRTERIAFGLQLLN